MKDMKSQAIIIEPQLKSITGSIFEGEKYGLDGVVIFRRGGFNPFFVDSGCYIKPLKLLEDRMFLKVYQSDKGSLRTVIVYTYSGHKHYDQFDFMLRNIMMAAYRHKIHHLGMNGIEFVEEDRALENEAIFMVRKVQEYLQAHPRTTIDDITFIDLRGAFDKAF